MNLKILLPTTMIILLLSLFACKKELTDLGSDLVTDGEKIVFTVDTIENILLNMEKDENIGYYTRVTTTNDSLILGFHKDYTLGNISADFISELFPPEFKETQFDKVKSIKKVELVFNPDTVIGTATPNISLDIYTLNERVKIDTFDSSNGNVDFYKSNYFDNLNKTKLNSISFTAKARDTFYFELPISIADKLIQKENTSIYKDENSFREHFKGFLFRTTSNENGVIRVNRNDFRIKIHFENVIKKGKDDVHLESDSVIYFKFIGSSRVLLNSDYTGTPFINDVDKDNNPKNVYTDSYGGPLIVINKQNIEKISTYDQKGKYINKAELILKVNSTDIEKDKNPSGLYMFGVDKNGKYTVISSTPLDVKKTPHEYRFPLTGYISNLEKNEYEKIVVSPNLLHPNFSNTRFLYKKLCFYSNVPDNQPQLIISYTKK